ncbi:MAG: lytic transglycosylase domain-containing protein [Nitrospiria bacterium]
MENRRIFLKRFLPRLAGIVGALSFSPSIMAAGLAATARASRSIRLDDPKYRALIRELTQKHRFDPADLKAIFRKVIFQRDIIEKFDRPAERLPYYEYQKRFINDPLIARGQAYLQENDPLLQVIEDKFHVEKEIVSSILGIETKFGQPGIEKYRAFDILNTAYALYPRREAFYRGELIAYLLLCREEGIDPFSIKSSYAGAFGVPQFIPSSFRRYAVDFDKDGKRDLWRSDGDIFASVANYLRKFGWRRDRLTYLPARIEEGSPAVQALVRRGIRKTTTVAKAIQMGVQIPEEAAQGEAEVSFAYYEPEKGKKALLALFDNFRAITRYNFSVNYALVVIHLSRRISSRG